MERRLRKEVGPDAFDNLYVPLDVLGGDEQPPLVDYLRSLSDLDVFRGRRG